jgi:hypothetical protein
MKPNIIRILNITALLSMFACLALLATRSYYAISFTEPLQGQTRGAEYESLLPIWSVLQGLPLYNDLTQIPFTATYYNWLYYVSYAGVSDVVLQALSLGDAWIPTITRITTLVGAIIGAVLMYASTVRLLPHHQRGFSLLTASVSTTVFLGPLTGYFAIATTPDIWPLVAAVAAMWIFIRYYESHPLSVVLGICLLSYVAWAFKQNFAYIPATVGLFLLIRRDWRNAAILTVVMCAAGVATLLLGGTEYRKMLLFGETHLSLTFEQLGINLFNMTVKTLPVLALVGVLVVSAFSASSVRHAFAEMFRQRSILMLPFLGVLISMLESIPTSAIVAAAENHYFHMIYFLAFSGLILLHQSAVAWKPMIWMALCAGFIGNTLAIATVFMGLQGSLSVRGLHDLLTNQNGCLNGLSRSIFVDDPRLMLPWMVPADHPFVLEFSYESDRAKGVKFEGGGIGGLISKGYFDQIALLKWRGRQFDGSDLSLYPYLIRSCSGLMVYSQRPLSEN